MNIKKFTFWAGVAFIAAGILGFIPGILQPPHTTDPNLAVEAAHGRLFGLFPVNALHNLVHLALGVWAILASKDVASSRAYCRISAVLYGVLAIFGLFPNLNTLFGLAPLYGHDVWLHILFVIPLAYYGYVRSEGPVRMSRPGATV
ncbi:MAG: DUF4383 domain-containing protein [Bdellovibrionales bacterium]